MATPAHCFYCFESLAASYDGNDPISLAVVEELWERYEQFKKFASLRDEDESLLLERTEVSAVNTSGESAPGEHPQTIKLPTIDRLQTQAASDGSVSTTPSAMSNKSSSSIFSNATTSSSVSSQPDTPAERQNKLSEQKYPLFVTWNTLSKGGRKSLRGCIGTFEAQELSRGLKSYALTSAFDDTRFSPIPESLFPSLSCSLTLLGTFEPCTNALDWTLGVHGIRISFIHRGRRYGATYLPDVPVEQGWTKDETVKSLMHKAGWDAPAESHTRRFLRGSSSGEHTNSTKPWDQVSDFRTVKYQGLKSSASYAEWQSWRDWVLSQEDGSEQWLEPAA
ncbi:AMMECR1 domain-containing protein [Aspergillus pseudoustus]|uniref:AMMECR1 domain-containing protein n=1 Tax=Aspergillus pseudoustus TaxID=1810923 RepID=A0ABR4JGA7_9EURO